MSCLLHKIDTTPLVEAGITCPTDHNLDVEKISQDYHGFVMLNSSGQPFETISGKKGHNWLPNAILIRRCLIQEGFFRGFPKIINEFDPHIDLTGSCNYRCLPNSLAAN